MYFMKISRGMNNEPAGTRLAGQSYCRRPGQAPTSQLSNANSSCGYTSCLVEVSKDVGKRQEHKVWVGKFIKSFFLLSPQIPDKAETGKVPCTANLHCKQENLAEKSVLGSEKSGKCISLWAACLHFNWRGAEKLKCSTRRQLWAGETPLLCRWQNTALPHKQRLMGRIQRA